MPVESRKFRILKFNTADGFARRCYNLLLGAETYRLYTQRGGTLVFVLKRGFWTLTDSMNFPDNYGLVTVGSAVYITK